MSRRESNAAGILRLVAAALTLCLLEALFFGGIMAAAQSASFAWLSVGGETHRTSIPAAVPPANTNHVSSGVAVTIGVTGGVFLDRLFLGGSADVRTPRATRTGTAEMRVAGGSGRLRVGYGFVLNDRFLLYPTAGIGIGGTEVRLTKAGEESALDGASQIGRASVPVFGRASGRDFQSVFRRSFGTATVQINGDLMRRSHSAGGPNVGWSLGVQHTFGHGDWRLQSGPGLAGHSSASIDTDRTALTVALRIGWGISGFRR